MNRDTLFLAVGLLTTIVGAGTVFFHYVEGWSWLDSYFFTVVTLSTVGYGSLVPATALGKIGTTLFIFLGIGLVALVIQQIGQSHLQYHVNLRRRRREARKRAHDKEKAR